MVKKSKRARQQTMLQDLASPVVDHASIPAREGSYWRTVERITLQLEYVDCGKCPRAHGPYWYAYQRQGGTLRKAYIGKRRNDEKARALLA